MNRFRSIVVAGTMAVLAVGPATPAHGATLSGLQHDGQNAAAQPQRAKGNGKAVRAILRSIRRVAHDLTVTETIRLKPVTQPDDRAAVLANIASDRAALKVLAAKARAATTAPAVAAVRTGVAQFRSMNYVLAIGNIRTARGLIPQVAWLATEVWSGSPQADAQSAALAGLFPDLDRVLAAAHTVTARTPQADLDANQAVVEHVIGVYDAVDLAIFTDPNRPPIA